MILNLKSNMDRFIAIGMSGEKENVINLKSNMDRFIASTAASGGESSGFKIQYG